MNKGLSALTSAALGECCAGESTDCGSVLKAGLFQKGSGWGAPAEPVCAGTAAERLTKANVCENHVATWQGRALLDLISHLQAPLLLPRPSLAAWAVAEPRGCSSGLQGEWARLRLDRAGQGRLSDCTIFSYRLCWDPRVAGEGLLWLNAAWIYMCNIL